MAGVCQAVTVKVLELESERADPRLDWQGQELTFFFHKASKPFPGDDIDVAGVHEAVSELDWCPLDGGNVLKMKVSGGWAAACGCALQALQAALQGVASGA